MKRTIFAAITIGIAALTLGCADSTPTAPTLIGASTTPDSAAQSAGLHKTSISGMMFIESLGPPERVILTPSGTAHRFHFPELTRWTGDIEGTVTFDASTTRAQDATHLIAHGPFEGDVTFRGRAGHIAGQWTTNCKWDASLGRVSCGGVMNARGSGELDGATFHIEWGPGWWPFPFSGTALSPW